MVCISNQSSQEIDYEPGQTSMPEMLYLTDVFETIYDQLKNISKIEHCRHRSYTGFMVNLLAGQIAYTYLPKKPSIKIQRDQGMLIPMIIA